MAPRMHVCNGFATPFCGESTMAREWTRPPYGPSSALVHPASESVLARDEKRDRQRINGTWENIMPPSQAMLRRHKNINRENVPLMGVFVSRPPSGRHRSWTPLGTPNIYRLTNYMDPPRAMGYPYWYTNTVVQGHTTAAAVTIYTEFGASWLYIAIYLLTCLSNL